jgi:phosphonate transport system permease protein
MTPSAPACPLRPDAPRPLDAVTLPRVLVVVALIAVGISLPGIHGSGRDLDHWANLTRMLGRFVPPDWSILPQVGIALVETAQIAVVATAVSVVLSVPLAIASSRRLSPSWLVWTSRMVLNAIRTVPSLIWALIAVALVGANPLAGVIALVMYSLGYLGTFIANSCDSVDPSAWRALRQLGADRMQAAVHGFWPELRPHVWSHALWMAEYNLRSASIIGYVGAGGLGVLMHSCVEYGAWDQMATILLALLAVVVVLDVAGDRVRRSLVGDSHR